MGNFQDLTGQTFNRLTAIERGPNDKAFTRWYCRCTCGAISLVRAAHLKNSNTKSCGCWEREQLAQRSTTHGKSGTREHRIWKAMLNRCRNPKYPEYALYGGRGIKVEKRWWNFQAFLDDMGACPENKSIDRKDPNKGYNRKNCRWATAREQGRTRRNNRWIEFNGRRMIFTDWAAYLGVKPSMLWKRLARMPLKEAMKCG